MDNEKSNIVIANNKFGIESTCVFELEDLKVSCPVVSIADEVSCVEGSYRRFIDGLPMIPYKFKEEMAMIERVYGDDPETMHEKMDHLMAITLRKLGYGDGVDIFDRVTKWYA